MEDELSQDRAAFATPSVDPLDAAIAQLEAEQAKGRTEQEPEKADTTSTVTTAEDDPDDDDFEDDDEPDVANTPGDADEDEDDASPESQQQKKPAKPATPAGDKRRAKGTDSEDDDSTLSRKQRGKLITELRQELEREQEEKRVLAESLKQQTEEDERLDKEVDRALGSDADFEKAMEDGLAGDDKAAERARVWKANREFYKKLVNKSKRDGTAQFMTTYWQEVSGLPGVTKEALNAPALSAILKNLYDAGVASVKDASTEEVEKLTADVNTWKGRYKKLKLTAGGSKTSPLGSGGSTSVDSAFDWQKKWTDPKTGLLTDEADAIVARHGVQALMDPKFRKR